MNNALVLTFSIFGNFTAITSNIVNIVKKFPAYEKNVENQVNNLNGFVSQIYVIRKPLDGLNIGSTRIDYFYNIDFDDKNVKNINEMISMAKSNFEKVLSGYNYMINRIAINSSYFFEDTSNNKIKLLLSKKASELINNNSAEFNLRFNSPVEIEKKMFNDILTISHGGIQNRFDFTTKNGLLLQNDFNSVVGVFSELNSIELSFSYFKEMLKVSSKNIKSINEVLMNEQ